MRQGLAAQRIIGQNHCAIAHLRHIMLIHIKAFFVDAVRRTALVLLHILRIHVAVFVERKRKPIYRALGIAKRVVIAKRFIIELDGHDRSLLSVQHKGLALET